MFQSMYAWSVIDWVAVPGPPPSRMFGMSMILKPSMRRMRMIVVVTGRMRRQRDVAEALPAARAVDEGRLADLLVEALERGQQDDEHERRPLPRVADDHGARGPATGR